MSFPQRKDFKTATAVSMLSISYTLSSCILLCFLLWLYGQLAAAGFWFSRNLKEANWLWNTETKRKHLV